MELYMILGEFILHLIEAKGNAPWIQVSKLLLNFLCIFHQGILNLSLQKKNHSFIFITIT